MGGRRVRVKTKGFIKPLALGGGKGFEFARTVRVLSSRALGGEGVRYGRMGKTKGFIEPKGSRRRVRVNRV